ncbi:hypothetical protein CAPTEDRAFT_97820 [Capitella teleta]|uniref:Calpain catalytic domain-containing protein n=1 Tax=Capitella teleta TaxID=283909 RepID=R7TWH9_CAPTE|nr:hypothetical protein CAPTEDRAFT_97820 [Capitella teleta]|eukprot:ELT98268.1 hypothetical protein CAPTEDRAFT_97820 [Capitella teleta]
MCCSPQGLSEAQRLLDALPVGVLYEDPDFPADNQALYASTPEQANCGIQWKRPSQLVPEGKSPHMLVDGISRDDIKQGVLGDCWFLSSCAAVSQQEKFMRKIIPDDQPLCGSAYKGCVHFCFWRFGSWVDVVIDDRLPVKEGELIYGRCEDPTEFWVALVEKAYAKLHGSYEAIEGGQTMDALVDLTGGLAERYEVKGADPNMYRYLLRAHKAGSFVACSRKGDWRKATKAEANGLVSGHAYTITRVMRISHRMGEERLLRIRNPWGNETEWKGSWSDDDSNWQWVDDDTKRYMEMTHRDDGEFWMSFKDFCRHFQEVTICTTGPDFDGDGVTDAGHMICIQGSWQLGVSAGGSRNNLERFATNPQYFIALTEPDDFDPMTDDPVNEGKCSVVIALMQEHRRSHRRVGVKTLQIGFILYQTSNAEQRLPAKHFKYNYDSGKSGIYINLREVSGRFELEPGHYIIIPSTFKPDLESSFLLRVYAQKAFTITGYALH